MIYRDTQGRTIQENTRTDNSDAARRMLVERALETARAKVLALEEMRHEAAHPEARAAHPASNEAGHHQQHGPRKRPVRHHAPVGGDGGKENRGGKTK
jgi:hypothetical protein